ncbi:hypothetical protein EW026_g1080 [Hermanssonia centrifuga]|uniref:Uncharacterized protein n=1 Tax=Hermanssonia centrifuga TaxID=98765 RepID=A0A4S4KSK0_9APHY|nr:hypothetical protein EW026_g1080 [Hermanssonia centrifuga]
MSRRTGKKVDRFVDLEIPEYWRSTVVSLDFELTRGYFHDMPVGAAWRALSLNDQQAHIMLAIKNGDFHRNKPENSTTLDTVGKSVLLGRFLMGQIPLNPTAETKQAKCTQDLRVRALDFKAKRNPPRAAKPTPPQRPTAALALAPLSTVSPNVLETYPRTRRTRRPSRSCVRSPLNQVSFQDPMTQPTLKIDTSKTHQP